MAIRTVPVDTLNRYSSIIDVYIPHALGATEISTLNAGGLTSIQLSNTMLWKGLTLTEADLLIHMPYSFRQTIKRLSHDAPDRTILNLQLHDVVAAMLDTGLGRSTGCTQCFVKLIHLYLSSTGCVSFYREYSGRIRLQRHLFIDQDTPFLHLAASKEDLEDGDEVRIVPQYHHQFLAGGRKNHISVEFSLISPANWLTRFGDSWSGLVSWSNDLPRVPHASIPFVDTRLITILFRATSIETVTEAGNFTEHEAEQRQRRTNPRPETRTFTATHPANRTSWNGTSGMITLKRSIQAKLVLRVTPRMQSIKTNQSVLIPYSLPKAAGCSGSDSLLKHHKGDDPIVPKDCRPHLATEGWMLVDYPLCPRPIVAKYDLGSRDPKRVEPAVSRKIRVNANMPPVYRIDTKYPKPVLEQDALSLSGSDLASRVGTEEMVSFYQTSKAQRQEALGEHTNHAHLHPARLKAGSPDHAERGTVDITQNDTRATGHSASHRRNLSKNNPFRNATTLEANHRKAVSEATQDHASGMQTDRHASTIGNPTEQYTSHCSARKNYLLPRQKALNMLNQRTGSRISSWDLFFFGADAAMRKPSDEITECLQSRIDESSDAESLSDEADDRG